MIVLMEHTQSRRVSVQDSLAFDCDTVKVMIHKRWKVALGGILVLLGALGLFLLLIALGAIQTDAPTNEQRSLPLPEGISEADLCTAPDQPGNCWIEVVNQPDCYVFFPGYGWNLQVSWHGECSQGLAEGTGTWEVGTWERLFILRFFRTMRTAEGLLVRGRKQGPWKEQSRGGTVMEESYLDGLRHGPQLRRESNGNTIESRYLLGKQYGDSVWRGPDGELLDLNHLRKQATEDDPVANGYRHGMREIQGNDGEIREVFFVENHKVAAWGPAGTDEELQEAPFPASAPTGNYLLRLANGTEAEGPLIDGDMHGEWSFRYTNGNVSTGRYAANMRDGEWTDTLADGTVSKGPYRGSRRHGKWLIRHANGQVQEGTYANGRMKGNWITTLADGTVSEGPYSGGNAHGKWVYRFPNGQVSEGYFVDGKRTGHWILRSENEDVHEGPFLDGLQHGVWVERSYEGDVMEGPYEKGLRHGNWVFRFHEGEVHEGPYAEGKRHGVWTLRLVDGEIIKEHWQNGEYMEPQ